MVRETIEACLPPVCREQCIDHIPYCLSGLSRSHFFSTTFRESESDKYALLTKREVKMAGFWPSSFLCFIYRDKVEVNKKRKKIDQYTAILTERAWSIIYPQVANQNEGFPFILRKQKKNEQTEYNKTKKPLLTRCNLPVVHLQTTLFLDSERPRMKQKQVVDTEHEARPDRRQNCGSWKITTRPCCFSLISAY